MGVVAYVSLLEEKSWIDISDFNYLDCLLLK